jgi:hypothetical protein
MWFRSKRQKGTDMVDLLNKKDDGVVTSNSFNLTRITGALAIAIGAGTAISGAAAEGTAGLPDWANFTQSQRLVIIVAVIAAWTVVTASDILGRSFATGQSNQDAPVLLKPIRAARITPAQGVQVQDQVDPGSVCAVRTGTPVTFLWQSSDASTEAIWLDQKFLDFTK